MTSRKPWDESARRTSNVLAPTKGQLREIERERRFVSGRPRAWLREARIRTGRQALDPFGRESEHSSPHVLITERRARIGDERQTDQVGRDPRIGGVGAQMRFDGRACYRRSQCREGVAHIAILESAVDPLVSCRVETRTIAARIRFPAAAPRGLGSAVRIRAGLAILRAGAPLGEPLGRRASRGSVRLSGWSATGVFGALVDPGVQNCGRESSERSRGRYGARLKTSEAAGTSPGGLCQPAAAGSPGPVVGDRSYSDTIVEKPAARRKQRPAASPTRRR